MPGLFLTIEDVVALHKEMRRMPPAEVDEELRGWSYGSGALAPGGGPLLGVADIGGFCEKGRDAYLRYARRVQQRDNRVLQRGRLIHEAWTRSISYAKRAVYSGAGPRELYDGLMAFAGELRREAVKRYELLEPATVEWVVERVVGEAARTYSSALERQMSRSRFLELDGLASATVPMITEFPVNGERIGLSGALRVDALLPPSLILELKTRPPRELFEVALTGYALAIESEYEVPVDRGILVYVEVDEKQRRLYVRPRVVTFGNRLRSAFVERRDRIKEAIAYGEDPGLAPTCPPECPYLWYCRGGSE